MAVFSFVVDKSGERLDQFLSKKTGQSRAFVQEQLKLGRIRRNDSPTSKASQKLHAGDKLTGEFQEENSTDLVPVAHPLDVLFEDEHFLVLNKPQGMVVHPATGHRGETLVHYLLHYLNQDSEFTAISSVRPGIVHRLDRGTSGVILIAKTRRVQELLSAMFKRREMAKEYEALAWGKMKSSGLFKSVMGRDKVDRKKMSSRTQKGREAVTSWETKESFPHFTHVALFPKTGRTHQLRVHLSENGNPIVSDALYGKSSRTKRVKLSETLESALESFVYPFLHARRLEFTHPVTAVKVAFEAPRPREFEELLTLIRKADR